MFKNPLSPTPTDDVGWRISVPAGRHGWSIHGGEVDLLGVGLEHGRENGRQFGCLLFHAWNDLSLLGLPDETIRSSSQTW